VTASFTGVRTPLRVLGSIAGAGITVALLAAAYEHVAGNRMAPWIIGRASGVCAYLLLVGLVLLGLVLAHPARARLGGSTPGRVRAHIALSVFTLAFTALHVVVLATDRYAGVGWSGALLPLHASYRPVPVTIGLIGVWAGLLAGLSAAAAGRLPRRVWWPLHKVAAVSLVLIWVHGVLAGGDTPALLALYVGSGVAVLAVAAWRYGTGRRGRIGGGR
jgi:hypothetical protein